MTDALLLVDVQRDRFAGGAIPLVGAPAALAVMERLLPRFALRFAALDWHPEQSVDFDARGPHCLAQSEGAALPAALQGVDFTALLRKGVDAAEPGHSAFRAKDADLELLLREARARTLYVCGLGTEVGVLRTVVDAVACGFDVVVVVDALAHHAEDQAPGEPHPLQQLADAGARLVHSALVGD